MQKKNMTGDDSEEPDTNINEHTYDVNVVPPLGIWIDLKNGIKFMRQLEEGEGEKSKKVKTTYFLQADAKSSGSKQVRALPNSFNTTKWHRTLSLNHTLIR